MNPHRTDKSYFHRGGEPALLGLTIGEHFTAIARQHGEREAVISRHQQRRMTYGELARETDVLARALMALGFERGERVGIWSTNNIEWLLLQLATARIGVVLVNINPAYRVEELNYALQRCEVQGLFVIPAFRHSDYVAMLAQAIPELLEARAGRLHSEAFPALREVVLYDPRAAMRTERLLPGASVWREVLEQARSVDAGQLQARAAGLDFDDPINIQYTSGTTGFPKAVVLTHHNILNNAWFSARAMYFNEQDRLCVPVPFYHCFGMVLANLLCLSVGACLVLPAEHFDALEVLRAIAEEGCTAIHGVPTMFIAALEHERFAEFDLSSLRTGIMAGAPCPPALMRRVIEDMHCAEILIGYGETEASPLTHLTSREDAFERRVNSVGRNLPHQEVKVVDAGTGTVLPLGEDGEICFRGYHVMRGYYGDPEATARAIDDSGWLRSGDIGKLDAEGYLRITGRLKEMIIRGGENIYPREIEDYLFSHPKVAQVAVFGIPDDFYGEQVVAWVQARPGEQLDEQELREYCRGHLAHFKVPRYIRIVDGFPMTVTGKIQKFRMREQAMAMLDAMKREP